MIFVFIFILEDKLFPFQGTSLVQLQVKVIILRFAPFCYAFNSRDTIYTVLKSSGTFYQDLPPFIDGQNFNDIKNICFKCHILKRSDFLFTIALHALDSDSTKVVCLFIMLGIFLDTYLTTCQVLSLYTMSAKNLNFKNKYQNIKKTNKFCSFNLLHLCSTDISSFFSTQKMEKVEYFCVCENNFVLSQVIALPIPDKSQFESF